MQPPPGRQYGYGGGSVGRRPVPADRSGIGRNTTCRGCLVSPIYFYPLPAQAKALVDRAQAFWHLSPDRKPGGGRRLGVVLLGARPRGDKLFSGALLTVRYMAEALGLTAAEPLLLYGLDGADALRSRPDLGERVTEYGRALAAAV